ncbi:MAG: hypothetical protein L3J87_02480 [Thermoplasmata archaeon]|nr:hypothetical protein [Thermoplasmata archaeon]
MSVAPAPRRRPTGASGPALIVVGVLLALGGLGWSYWLCADATYNCPAHGCDGVPQYNCLASVSLLPAISIAAASIAAVGGVSLALSARRPGPLVSS